MAGPEAEIAPDPYGELVAELEARTAVDTVDVYYDDHSAGGAWRVEAIVAREFDTVPAAVLRPIVAVELGIRDVTPRAAYQDLRVIVE